MDNRYYDQLLQEMRPFLEENGFSAAGEGCFQSEKKALKIEYNEEKQSYILHLADVEDGVPGEYAAANTWLFDDSQNAKDAQSVGIDFTATLREAMGIRNKRGPVTDVELPSMSKTGNITVSGFAKKLLDVFPALKDHYREHIAVYGNFLYLHFFGEFVAPRVKEVLLSGNKKQIKKLNDLLGDVYVAGDKDTVNSVVAVLAAACDGDAAATAAMQEMLEENTHFRASVENFIPVLAKNKKLRQALIHN